MDADGSPASGLERGAFVVAHQEELRTYAARQLTRMQVPSGRLQVEDVVNHTVTELLERWDTINEPRRYMYSVVRHFVLRAAREAGRFTGAPAGAGVDGEPGVEDRAELPPGWVPRPPEQEAVDRVILGQLRAGTSPLQREAVFLVDGAGLSREQAGRRMDVATGTVSAHRARGLEKMRELAATLGLIVAFVVAAGGLTAGMAWAFIRLLREGADHALALPNWAAAALSLGPAVLVQGVVLYRHVRRRRAVGTVVRAAGRVTQTVTVSGSGAVGQGFITGNLIIYGSRDIGGGPGRAGDSPPSGGTDEGCSPRP